MRLLHSTFLVNRINCIEAASLFRVSTTHCCHMVYIYIYIYIDCFSLDFVHRDLQHLKTRKNSKEKSKKKKRACMHRNCFDEENHDG